MKRIAWLLVFALIVATTGISHAVFIDLAPEDEVLVPADDPWPRRIVVTVGGDTTLGCTDSQRGRADGFAAVIREKGYAWPFSGLLPLFANDDMTIVNFEGTLTESKDKVEKLFNFKGPAEYAQMLTLGSVEAVTLANNHFIDYGQVGKDDTMAALDAENVQYAVGGTPLIYEVRGVKIGLIANSFPYASGKKDISSDVKALQAEGCSIVIATFHWGNEYEKDYSRDQRNIGRAAIDAGASAVFGHHPHIVQGIEAYKDSYILYSVGNLVFGGNTDPSDRDAYVAQFSFLCHEDGRVEGPELRIVPIRLTSQASGTDYRPVIAQGDTTARILQKILARSVGMKNFINPTE